MNHHSSIIDHLLITQEFVDYFHLFLTIILVISLLLVDLVQKVGLQFLNEGCQVKGSLFKRHFLF